MSLRARIRPILLASLAAFLIFPSAASLQAQDNRNQLRTVHGMVVDKGDNAAPSSIVYLVNAKTQAVKTYIADETGNYRFSGLDPNTDYEIHAERDNTASPNRTISSFDSRRDIDLTLKLSRTKSGS